MGLISVARTNDLGLGLLMLLKVNPHGAVGAPILVYMTYYYCLTLYDPANACKLIRYEIYI